MNELKRLILNFQNCQASHFAACVRHVKEARALGKHPDEHPISMEMLQLEEEYNQARVALFEYRKDNNFLPKAPRRRTQEEIDASCSALIAKFKSVTH